VPMKAEKALEILVDDVQLINTSISPRLVLNRVSFHESSQSSSYT
jgi:hypothetical protein